MVSASEVAGVEIEFLFRVGSGAEDRTQSVGRVGRPACVEEGRGGVGLAGSTRAGEKGGGANLGAEMIPRVGCGRDVNTAGACQQGVFHGVGGGVGLVAAHLAERRGGAIATGLYQDEVPRPTARTE